MMKQSCDEDAYSSTSMLKWRCCSPLPPAARGMLFSPLIIIPSGILEPHWLAWGEDSPTEQGAKSGQREDCISPSRAESVTALWTWLTWLNNFEQFPSQRMKKNGNWLLEMGDARAAPQVYAELEFATHLCECARERAEDHGAGRMLLVVVMPFVTSSLPPTYLSRRLLHQGTREQASSNWTQGASLKKRSH